MTIRPEKDDPFPVFFYSTRPAGGCMLDLFPITGPKLWQKYRSTL